MGEGRRLEIDDVTGEATAACGAIDDAFPNRVDRARASFCASGRIAKTDERAEDKLNFKLERGWDCLRLGHDGLACRGRGRGARGTGSGGWICE